MLYEYIISNMSPELIAFLQGLKPDIYELLVFVVFISAIYMISALYFYSSVQSRVKSESRCMRDKQSVSSNGVFTVTASNQRNEPLYTVGYNMSAKSYAVECSCPAGEVTNTYPNIDVFDLNTQQAHRIDSKVCACDKQYYSPNFDSIYYSGYPGVKRFMNTASLYSNSTDVQTKADSSFFDAALNG